MKLNAKILIACTLLTFTSLDLLSARRRPHNRREQRAENHANRVYEELCKKQEAEKEARAKMLANPVVVYTAWRRDHRHVYTVGLSRVPDKFYNQGQTVQALLESARPHCDHLGADLRAFAARPNQPDRNLETKQELDLKQQLAHRSIVIVNENDAQAIRDKKLRAIFAAEPHPLSARAQRRADLKKQQADHLYSKDSELMSPQLAELTTDDNPISAQTDKTLAKETIISPPMHPDKDREKDEISLALRLIKKTEETTAQHLKQE